MHFITILKVNDVRAHYRTVYQPISSDIFGETDNKYELTSISSHLSRNNSLFLNVTPVFYLLFEVSSHLIKLQKSSGGLFSSLSL